ncbi:MAG: AIR synthase-related protein [Lachnospiraceae bacterium]|nr:AIR synthase-related protein [Lachnospiraceae bacterium]
MNYREKQKKDPAEKKIRKLSAFRKRYPDTAAEGLVPELFWEEQCDSCLEELSEKGQLMPAPGQELFMTGWVGAAGTLLLADWKKEQLCTRFPAAFVHTAWDREVFDNYRGNDSGNPYFQPAAFLAQGASWIAPVGEGGLMKTLYRLGKETGLGFRINSRRVPIRQITIEFTEFFRVHPWELFTGRSFLFAAEHDAPILRSLEQQGILCSKVGVLTKEKQKLICHGQEESNINRPEPDGLLTLLMEEIQP